MLLLGACGDDDPPGDPGPTDTGGEETVEADEGPNPDIDEDECNEEGKDCPQPSDDCMQALCVNRKCQAPEPKENGAECATTDKCAAGGVCEDGACAAGAPKVCEEDSDPCTELPTCDPGTGDCVEEAITDCCIDAAECDDSDDCTTDSCNANACVNMQIADCCAQAADCDDNDPCTEDTCGAADTCVYTAIAGCGGCGDDCPLKANCDFCPLAGQACNAVDPLGCHATVLEMIDAGELPGVGTDNDGNPIYPACLQPTCGAEGCTLGPVPGCCKNANECPLPSDSCFFAQCVPETAAPPHLVGNPPLFCELNIIEGCCADEVNQVLEEETFSQFPNLPQGWTVLDQHPNDNVSWHEVEKDDLRCFSGGHCLALGARTNVTDEIFDYCFTYFNGPLDGACQPIIPDPSPCVTTEDCALGQSCEPSADDPDVLQCTLTPVAVTLASPQHQLLPADVPWALQFRLRMNTEPPASGLPGDALRLFVVRDDNTELQVFDSSTLGNSTLFAPKGYALIAVDLSAFAGDTIRLEWRFDTNDNYENGYESVYIDDVVLQSICENSLCDKPGDAVCAAANACENAQCAIFEAKSLLSTETITGYCISPLVEGCQPCVVNEDCDSPPTTGGPYNAACEDGVCDYESESCQAETLLEETFDTLPADWATLHDPPCGNFWAASAARSTDGSTSLHFGQAGAACGADPPLCGAGNTAACPTYDCDDNGTFGTLTTGAYSLPDQGTLLLSFDLFLVTEWDDITFDLQFCDDFGFCVDRLMLFAILSDTGAEIMVWDSYHADIEGSTQCGWKAVSVNLDNLGGKNVSFRFEFDSGGKDAGAPGSDASNNEYEGPYIDKFTLETLCEVPCENNDGCDDKNACTTDTCAQGLCQNIPIDGCCTPDFEDPQCADGNACTLDACGDDQKCTHEINLDDASCCAQDAVYWEEAFDGDALPEGWTIEIPETAPQDVKWQFVADGGAGGSGGVVFTNLANGTYAAPGAAAKGFLTTPPFTVPPGAEPVLRFDLELSTEFDTYEDTAFESYLATSDQVFFDRLAAYATVDGGKSYQLIWRSDNAQPLSGTTLDPDGNVVWQDVGFSLGLLAGFEDVQIRFEFDALTADENQYAGVKLDNMRLTQACSSGGNPNPCLSTAWCEDGNGCSIDSCTAGVCDSEDAVGKPGCCFVKPVVTFDFASDAAGWVTEPEEDTTGWHLGDGELSFGNPQQGDYSSCFCAEPSGPMCDAGCPDAECVTESGQDAPGGTALSPPFELTLGEDYTISFSLNADLSVAEGAFGFVEAFTVDLVWIPDEGGVQVVATLVCHAGKCDVLGDACASGINFDYPGCSSPQGDYGQWKEYNFSISEALCGENATDATDVFLTTLKTPGKTVALQLRIDFQTLDNIENCGTGLHIDNVVWGQLCPGPDGVAWDGTCGP